MAYTPDKPKLAPDGEALRQRIPGWGVDLDRERRPAVPKEHFIYPATGAHWEFPERQVPKWPRERSTEHKFLTPVFGTACPPTGLSGLIRRYAYARFSEARSAHWLLLMLADRINVAEGFIAEALRGRPDNLLAEYGVTAELTRGGLSSRLGRRRADVRRLPIDILSVAGTWLIAAGAVGAVRAVKRMRAKARKRGRLATLLRIAA